MLLLEVNMLELHHQNFFWKQSIPILMFPAWLVCEHILKEHAIYQHLFFCTQKENWLNVLVRSLIQNIYWNTVLSTATNPMLLFILFLFPSITKWIVSASIWMCPFSINFWLMTFIWGIFCIKWKKHIIKTTFLFCL